MRIRKDTILSFCWLLLTLIINFSIHEELIYNMYVVHDWLVIFNIISYLSCFYTWYNAGGRLISLYNIFITYLMFSSLGQSILTLLDINIVSAGIYSLYSLKSICDMLALQLICIAGLNFGVACYFQLFSIDNLSRSILSARHLIDKKYNVNLSFYERILFIVLLISILWVFIYTIYQINMRATLSYSDLYSTRESLSKLPQYLTVVLGIYFILKGYYVNFIFSVWLWFVLAYFFVGTRSMSITYICSLLVCSSIKFPGLYSKNKLPFWGCFLFLFITLISVISNSRNNTFISIFNDPGITILASFFSSINEMGASARPIIIAMTAIDSGVPHYQTILYNILHWMLPTPILYFCGLEVWDVKLGEWVNTMSYTFDNQLGFSCIAEVYVNYGRFCWIFMILYGWIICWMENKSYINIIKGKFVFSSIGLGILAKQVFFARGNIELSLDYFRLTFLFILIYIFFRYRKNYY